MTDKSGDSTGNASFFGSGTAEARGKCGVGAEAIQQATEKAIRKAMEDRVDKMFNVNTLAKK